MPYYLHRVDPSGSGRGEWPGRIGGPYRTRREAERERRREAADIARGMSDTRVGQASDIKYFLGQLSVRKGD